MKVSFVDLRTGYCEIKDELYHSIDTVMESGRYILGEQVRSFEREFSSYCSAKHGIAVGSGLDALVLSLKALDIGPNDEVIVPAFTFIATWMAVSNVGAKLVPVDVDIETSNISAALLENAINENTKAIIIVHLFGQPCDMDKISEISEKYEIPVIEDAAQAHGAQFKNKLVGQLGSCAAFSFYPAKNLGAFGDGGMVVTNNSEISERIEYLRNYGSRQKYHHDYIGFNSRLDELQAAFLRVKLLRLDDWNLHRVKIANIYLSQIKNEDVYLPVIHANCYPVWHLFVVKVKNRNQFSEYLGSKNIETMIHYPVAPHLSGAYREEFKNLNFEVAERLSSEVLSLPIGPHISEEQAEYVVQAINAWNGKTNN